MEPLFCDDWNPSSQCRQCPHVCFPVFANVNVHLRHQRVLGSRRMGHALVPMDRIVAHLKRQGKLFCRWTNRKRMDDVLFSQRAGGPNDFLKLVYGNVLVKNANVDARVQQAAGHPRVLCPRKN